MYEIVSVPFCKKKDICLYSSRFGLGDESAYTPPLTDRSGRMVGEGREWGLGHGGGKAGEVLKMVTRNVMNFNTISRPLSNKK